MLTGYMFRLSMGHLQDDTLKIIRKYTDKENVCVTVD